MVIELTDGKITLDTFGNADTLEGVDEDKQILRNALLIFFGSWFDDSTVGPDWLNILEKGFTFNQIKSDISRVLNALDIVQSIVSISLGNVNSNREVELTFVVTTSNGNVDFSEVL